MELFDDYTEVAAPAFILRDCQREAVDAGLAFMQGESEHHFGLMVEPTSFGKSLLIANIIHELGEPVLVFQPSQEILMQNHEKLRGYGYHAAIFSAKMGRKHVSEITLATIGSAKNAFERFKHYKYVIVDEAHAVKPRELDKNNGYRPVPRTGGMYHEFVRSLHDRNGTRALGLTATPYRLSHDGFNGSICKFLTRTRGKLFDTVVHHTQNRFMADNGYWCPLQYRSVPGFERKGLEVNSTGSDFKDESLRRYFKEIGFHKTILKVVEKLLTIRKNVLVFTKFVDEANWIAANLGEHAKVISADTPSEDRKRIIRQYREGIIKVIANVGTMCLDEKTEILTASGWTGIDEMTYQHEIACWSMDGSIRFAPPRFIIRRLRGVDERMVSASGNAIDFRVTEHHRMVKSYGSDRRWTEALASTITGKHFDFPSSGYSDPLPMNMIQPVATKKEHRLRINSSAYTYRRAGFDKQTARSMAINMVDSRINMQYTRPEDLSLNECRFIGFWLADGCLSGGRCTLTQSMKYENVITWFNNVLESAGFHYSTSVLTKRSTLTNDVVRWLISRGTGGRGQKVKKGYFHLEPYLNKLGSNLMWGFNNDQYDALLEGYWYGDGLHGTSKYEDSSRTNWCAAGTQKSLYELLQAIGTCRGYRIILRPSRKAKGNQSAQWKIRWQKRQRTSIGWAVPQFEKVWIPERVWCVTSETTFIITRRNGVVTITGNTVGFDYPELESVVMARPTMSLALWTQIVGRGTRVAPGKDHCKIVDMCENLPLFGKVEDLTLHCKGHQQWYYASQGRILTNKGYGER